MKKIPTLFHREFENHKIAKITPEVTPGFEWVLEGKGIATIKYDGSCCAIIDGKFYKRYDAKINKKTGEFKNPPEGAIPCDDPDPITGHWPHWVPVDENNPDDKWFIIAKGDGDYSYDIPDDPHRAATYEAIGPHFQSNPYRLKNDALIHHGDHIIIELNKGKRSFEQIKEWLKTHNQEGIVFWKDGEPQCKIKRSDFGFEWPVK